jgi:hypothetical protein
MSKLDTLLGMASIFDWIGPTVGLAKDVAENAEAITCASVCDADRLKAWLQDAGVDCYIGQIEPWRPFQKQTRCNVMVAGKDVERARQLLKARR